MKQPMIGIYLQGCTMTESICVAVLGHGPLFDNATIEELQSESNEHYWKRNDMNKQTKLW